MSSSSMKSLSRSYFWWPGMDKEIENITHNYNNLNSCTYCNYSQC